MPKFGCCPMQLVAFSLFFSSWLCFICCIYMCYIVALIFGEGTEKNWFHLVWYLCFVGWQRVCQATLSCISVGTLLNAPLQFIYYLLSKKKLLSSPSPHIFHISSTTKSHFQHHSYYLDFNLIHIQIPRHLSTNLFFQFIVFIFTQLRKLY